MAFPLFVYILSLLFSSTFPLDINICDCSSAKMVGLMDVSTPDYCTSETKFDAKREALYSFHVDEEPHMTWKGYACWAWIQEKKIEGSFLYTFDTTFRKTAVNISDEECRKMAITNKCFGNEMMKDGELSTFNQEPAGHGHWWSTDIYTAYQCQLREIELSKECTNCPIVSPFGVHDNSTSARTALHHMVRMVWQMPDIFTERNRCNLRGFQHGRGYLHSADNDTMRLTDPKNQLDYIFRTNTTILCNNMTLHKLVNMKNGFISLFATPKTALRFQNKNTSLCLATDVNANLISTICDEFHPNQLFKLDEDNILHSGVHTYHYDPREIYPKVFSQFSRFYQKNEMRFSGSNGSFYTVAGTCIVDSGRFNPLFFEPCRPVDTTRATHNEQTWKLIDASPPQFKDMREASDNATLLMQHHQFIEDSSLDRANAILAEIKKIYCGNLAVRKYTTFLLASQSGILAAQSLKLPVCSKVKPFGLNFLVQQCAVKNVTVLPRASKCGIEPVINENFTIAADGFSLHPFPPDGCYWSSNLFNFNGKTFYYNDTDWVEKLPTRHLSTLRLVEKFNVVPDDEIRYLPGHHEVHTKSEFDLLNIATELASSIMVSNDKPLSNLILNSQTTAHGISLTSWASSAAAGFIGFFIVLAILASCFLCFYCGCAGPCFRCCTGTLCSCADTARDCCATCCERTCRPPTAHSHEIPMERGDGQLRWEDGCPVPTPAEVISLSPLHSPAHVPSIYATPIPPRINSPSIASPRGASSPSVPIPPPRSQPIRIPPNVRTSTLQRSQTFSRNVSPERVIPIIY